MDKMHQPPPSSGLKQLNLKKSFKLGIRSLLTACSKEEFFKTFSTFDRSKQERLYGLFIQVVNALDTVEQLVEEKAIDILSGEPTNIVDVTQEVLRAKKDEINYLTSMLKTVVEHNDAMKARIESLRKENQGSGVTTDAIQKLKSWKSNYGTISS